ncbi:MAG: hypothetical protein ISQ27_03640 [PS1 clade bacterium]|nr:hypothetical protein [PS1 clade bacterium]
MNLPFEVGKNYSPPTNWSQVVKDRYEKFFIKAAAGYLKFRNETEVRSVEFPPRSYTFRGNLRIAANPNIIWNLKNNRKCFISFYLQNLDETINLNKYRSDLIAALMAKNHDFDEGNVFTSIDLEKAIRFDIHDDGSRLIPAQSEVEKWQIDIGSKLPVPST